MTLRKFSTSSISTGTKSSKLWDQETFPGYFESIATVVVGSAGSSSISFSNIPQTYKDLKILMRSSTGSSINNLIEFNGDTTSSNYYYFGGQGNGSTASAIAFTNSNVISVDNTTGSTDFCHSVITMAEYSISTKKKIVYSRFGYEREAPAGITGWYGLVRSSSTDAITSITIKPSSGNFKEHSHFALYGIRG